MFLMESHLSNKPKQCILKIKHWNVVDCVTILDCNYRKNHFFQVWEFIVFPIIDCTYCYNERKHSRFRFRFLFLFPLSNLFHCLGHLLLYSKTPKQVFFNPINIFWLFYTTLFTDFFIYSTFVYVVSKSKWYRSINGTQSSCVVGNECNYCRTNFVLR